MLKSFFKYLIDYPFRLLVGIKINKKRYFLLMIIIYMIAILAAFFEGISLILLATIFTNYNSISDKLLNVPILQNISLLFKNFDISHVFLVLTLCFFLAFVFKWTLVFLEQFFVTKIRRKIQIQLFRKYLYSRWNVLRNFKVGHLVNINSTEARLAAKYVMLAIMFPTHVLICTVFFLLALSIDFKILSYLLIIIFPLFLIARLIIKKQAHLSVLLTNIRNSYASNIADRINGLLDIYNSKKKEFHFKRGTIDQSNYTKAEVKVSVLNSIMATLNLSIPLIIFMSITIYSFNINKNFISIPLFELAAIFLLGYKSLSSINSLNLFLANIATISGSLVPIFEIFNLKKEITKKLINDNIDQIKFEKVNFKYGKNHILSNLNFTFYRGKINIIIGESGKGKTTIASLISGLQNPDSGKLIFKSKNKNSYFSSDYDFKVGYLTQDIYLFNDTIKDNLTLGEKINERRIWEILDNVNAKDFVLNAGGLLHNVQETGKNFSGGQIRRLGLARMLLLDNKILLLDEPLSGLDAENKKLFLNLISKLYNEFLVIIISHEEIKVKKSAKNILTI